MSGGFDAWINYVAIFLRCQDFWGKRKPLLFIVSCFFDERQGREKFLQHCQKLLCCLKRRDDLVLVRMPREGQRKDDIQGGVALADDEPIAVYLDLLGLLGAPRREGEGCQKSFVSGFSPDTRSLTDCC